VELKGGAPAEQRQRQAYIAGRRLMTMRPRIALSLALVFAGSGCARVQSKAAFIDGSKFYKEENYKRAIEKYERAVELDPNMAEGYFYLGSSHQNLYRPGRETPENKAHIEAAITNFKKSLEVNKGGTPNAKAVRVNALSALTSIYAEEPYKDFETSKGYAAQLVEENPNDTKNLYAMANLYEKFGHVEEAEATYKKIAELNPSDTKACGALANFYNKPLWDEKGVVIPAGSDKSGRARFEEAVTTLERCADLQPSDPGGWQKVAAFYWNAAYRDPLLDDKKKTEYTERGLQMVDKALQIKPDYFEAVIYKGLLYRVKATLTTNPTLRAQYMQEAQDLQKYGLELKKQQEAQQAAASPVAPTSGK
jgi:tetratricopeptide (TPR) repeat protein